MWENQTLFRVSAQVAAEGIFNLLDRTLKPEIFLVGLACSENTEHKVFMEPIDSGYEYDIFLRINPYAAQLKQAYARAPFLYQVHDQERHQKLLEQYTLKHALEQILEEENEKGKYGIISFSSWPVLINQYQVFVVLQFDRKAYQEHYTLRKDQIDEVHPLPTSLLDATVTEFLIDCSKALRESEPGFGSAIIDRDYFEILRAAGKRLMNAPAKGNFGLFDAFNAVSSLRYEGDETIGSILLAKRGHPNIKKIMTLESPVPMRDYRSIRKLLEVTENEISLVSDAAYVYGLGYINGPYDPERQDLFRVHFLKHYSWQICHDGHILMNVTYGQPSLQKRSIDRSRFSGKIHRIFQDITDEAVEKLWILTLEATQQKHGTLLVISSGAAAEALRLSQQCFKITPTLISTEVIKLVSRIDGAVLIDPDAICHAIGVILDGLASQKGDPARGSRYNSAVRYVESSQHPCFAIVVSEDGMIDLIPNVHPQIKRSEIEVAVKELVRLNNEVVPNCQDYRRIMVWLQQHSFYLQEEMCKRINTLKNQIEQKLPARASHIRFRNFMPNPEMNNSYFSKEDKPAE